MSTRRWRWNNRCVCQAGWPAAVWQSNRLGVAGGGVGPCCQGNALQGFVAFIASSSWSTYMVIYRACAVDREYEGMLFEDVFGEREFLPMAHVGGLPHRVLAKDVMAARRRWEEAKHPLFQFMVHTHHPDLDLRTLDFIFPAGTGTMPRGTANCLRQVIEDSPAVH